MQTSLVFNTHRSNTKIPARPDGRPPVDTCHHSNFCSVQWRATKQLMCMCRHAHTELYIGPKDDNTSEFCSLFLSL